MPENFSFPDLFGPSPARPEHPDFWKLSSVVLDLDGAMAERGKESIDDVIARKAAEVGDSYAICYMAVQRAMRVHNVTTMGELLQKGDAVVQTSVVYMEALIVGARFAAEKQERGRDEQ